MFDVIIVGGGPAGLSAALILGRARRSVLVCDVGRPRNAATRAVHGFLSRDGIAPFELLRVARKQLEPYSNVQCRDVEVTDVSREEDHFAVVLHDGSTLTSRKLLLATGVIDQVPTVEGIAGLYGKSVHHCPYCDGWEWRDAPVGVYGRGKRGVELALELLAWTQDLVLLTDGPSGVRRSDRERLELHHIAIRTERIARLEGEDGMLSRVVFESGDSLERKALFFNTGQRQRSPLAERIGCRFNSKGTVATGRHEATGIPGLFVVGDASHDVQFVVVAAAEGAKAAYAVNTSLIKEDLHRVEQERQESVPEEVVR